MYLFRANFITLLLQLSFVKAMQFDWHIVLSKCITIILQLALLISDSCFRRIVIDDVFSTQTELTVDMLNISTDSQLFSSIEQLLTDI